MLVRIRFMVPMRYHLLGLGVSHKYPTGSYDRIGTKDRLPNETGLVTILVILFILSKL